VPKNEKIRPCNGTEKPRYHPNSKDQPLSHLAPGTLSALLTERPGYPYQTTIRASRSGQLLPSELQRVWIRASFQPVAVPSLGSKKSSAYSLDHCVGPM